MKNFSTNDDYNLVLAYAVLLHRSRYVFIRAKDFTTLLVIIRQHHRQHHYYSSQRDPRRRFLMVPESPNTAACRASAIPAAASRNQS